MDTGQGEQGGELGEYGRKERTFLVSEGKGRADSKESELLKVFTIRGHCGSQNQETAECIKFNLIRFWTT